MSLSDIHFSLDDLVTAEADTANPYLADPARGLQLVTRLIAHPPPQRSHEQLQQLAHLHQLIHERFVSLAAGDDYPAEAQAFRELLALEESLKDLAIFPDLANKTIVGVGGGFSAGKSRFLNTLLGDALLPESLEPTTAIPSFITGGAASIVALNTFNHLVEMDADALQAISHAFYKHYQKTLGEEVGFAHVLKLLMIHRPTFRWDNVAFLDTPGYSKVAGDDAGSTDEEIALKQLTEADHIIWLLNAKNGSIRQDDLLFLRALNHPKPIFFVVTQADLVGSTRIHAILESTTQAIDAAGIARAGLMAWAAPLEAQFGERLAGDDILIWLNKLNTATKYTNKRRTCSNLLDKYIEHNTNALASNHALLSALNEVLPLAVNLADNRRDAITNQISLLKSEQRRLPALVQAFSELKQDMLDVIEKIIGTKAQDEEIKKGIELLFTVQRPLPVNVGEHLSIEVVSIKSDTKRVFFMVGNGLVEIWIPFSLIRSEWLINPLLLNKGDKFSAVVRDLSKTTLLSISTIQK